LNREIPICQNGRLNANDYSSGFCCDKADLKFPGSLKSFAAPPT
jgi:hypothetical protein